MKPILPNRKFNILLIIVGAIISTVSILLAALFRDGSGPDAVQTSGINTFYKIMSQSLISVSIGLALIILGIFMLKTHNKRINSFAIKRRPFMLNVRSSYGKHA